MISLGDVSCGHFPASSLGDILLQENASVKNSSFKAGPTAEGSRSTVYYHAILSYFSAVVRRIAHPSIRARSWVTKVKITGWVGYILRE